MNTWLYAYFIGSAASLLILIIMVFWQRDDMAAMKELSEKLLDKWAQTESRAKKLEKGLDWVLSRHGMKMEYSSFAWDWSVVPREKPKWYNDDAWHKFLENRNAIVYAIYEANKKALEDWDRENPNKEKKKGAKK